jgi:hypothetical protein
VGKKSSLAFLAAGVVLVVVAIVWWTVIAPSLVKLPNDINTVMNFEGTLTQYVDPATQQPLAAGSELKVPLTIARTYASVPAKYTSGVAVCTDTLDMTLAGQARPLQITQNVLDRKTRKSVSSDQGWAYSPQIVLADRPGHYDSLMPGGLKVGDVVSIFSDDVATPFDVKAVEKIDNWNGLGVTAIKIDATRAATPYHPAVAQAFLAAQSLPMELTFAQVSAQLKAKGLDLTALLTGLAAVASREDLQSLQTLAQQPVKVVYKQASADVIYVEQKTGATIGATLDRTTTMEIDSTPLLGAFVIVGKYASDPKVGPLVAGAMQAAQQLAQAAPTKVFNQNVSIIKTSEATLAKDAAGKASAMDLVDLWIPLIIVVVGFLVLVAGGYLLFRSRKAAARAS